jgi:hypothetical protein
LWAETPDAARLQYLKRHTGDSQPARPPDGGKVMNLYRTTGAVLRRLVPVPKWEREAKCRKKRLLFRFCLSPTLLVLVLMLSLVSMPLSGGYAADEFPELETFREMEAKRRAFFDDIKVHLHREEFWPLDKIRIVVDDSVSPPIIRESDIRVYDEEIWFKGENLMYQSIGPWVSSAGRPDDTIYKIIDYINVYNFNSDFSKSFSSETVLGEIPIGHISHNKKSEIFNAFNFGPIRLATGRSLEFINSAGIPFDIITREDSTYFENTPCTVYRFVRFSDKPWEAGRYDLFIMEEASFLPIGLNQYFEDKLWLTVSLSYSAGEGGIAVPIEWSHRQYDPELGQLWNSGAVTVTKTEFDCMLESSDFDIKFPPRTSFEEEFPDGRNQYMVVLDNGKLRRVTDAENERLMFAGVEGWEEVYKTPTGMAGLIKSEHLKIAKLFAIGIGLALVILFASKFRVRG